MVAADFVHLCDHAFRDAQNQPCLICIKSAIVATTFPCHRAALTVAFMVRTSEATKSHIDMWFGHADGTLLRKAGFDVDFKVPAEHFMAIQLVQLFFPKPGEYIVRLSEGNRDLASASLQILSVQALTPSPIVAQVAPVETTDD